MGRCPVNTEADTSCAATGRGREGLLRAPRLRRGKARFFLESLREAWSCWSLDFGLQASGNMEIKFLLFYATLVMYLVRHPTYSTPHVDSQATSRPSSAAQSPCSVCHGRSLLSFCPPVLQSYPGGSSPLASTTPHPRQSLPPGHVSLPASHPSWVAC